jgi:hypothetical protein
MRHRECRAGSKKEINDVCSMVYSKNIVKKKRGKANRNLPPNSRCEKKTEKLTRGTFCDERSTVSIKRYSECESSCQVATIQTSSHNCLWRYRSALAIREVAGNEKIEPETGSGTRLALACLSRSHVKSDRQQCPWQFIASLPQHSSSLTLHPIQNS